MPDITLVGRGHQKTAFDGNFVLSSGDSTNEFLTVQAGDLLLAFFQVLSGMGAQAATSVPTGWVEVGHSPNYLLRVYYKIAVAGEPSLNAGSAYTGFAGLCTGSSGSGTGSSNIMALRYVDRSNPIVAGSVTGQDGSSSTIWPFGAVNLVKRGRPIYASSYKRTPSGVINSGLHSDVSFFGTSTGVSATNGFGGRMSYGDTLQGSLGTQNVATSPTETLLDYGTISFGLRAQASQQGIL